MKLEFHTPAFKPSITQWLWKYNLTMSFEVLQISTMLGCTYTVHMSTLATAKTIQCKASSDYRIYMVFIRKCITYLSNGSYNKLKTFTVFILIHAPGDIAFCRINTVCINYTLWLKMHHFVMLFPWKSQLALDFENDVLHWQQWKSTTPRTHTDIYIHCHTNNFVHKFKDDTTSGLKKSSRIMSSIHALQFLLYTSDLHF